MFNRERAIKPIYCENFISCLNLKKKLFLKIHTSSSITYKESIIEFDPRLCKVYLFSFVSTNRLP